MIYGAQADPNRDFTQRAFDLPLCRGNRCLRVPHLPRLWTEHESGNHGFRRLPGGPQALRNLVTHYPGVKADIPFFDDEFNSIPSWVGSDESVQAKYIPRGFVYNLAAGVKTFVWLLAAGAERLRTNERGKCPPLYSCFSEHSSLFLEKGRHVLTRPPLPIPGRSPQSVSCSPIGRR